MLKCYFGIYSDKYVQTHTSAQKMCGTPLSRHKTLHARVYACTYVYVYAHMNMHMYVCMYVCVSLYHRYLFCMHTFILWIHITSAQHKRAGLNLHAPKLYNPMRIMVLPTLIYIHMYTYTHTINKRLVTSSDVLQRTRKEQNKQYRKGGKKKK